MFFFNSHVTKEEHGGDDFALLPCICFFFVVLRKYEYPLRMILFFCSRYMSILYPLRSVIRRGYTRYIILGLWLGSALASIPNAIQIRYFNVGEEGGPEYWVCTTGKQYSSFHHYLFIIQELL